MQLEGSINAQSMKPPARLVALNFRVPLDVRRKLRMVAAARDVTMSALILEALDQIVAAGADHAAAGFSVGESGFGR